jgi:hypothetical protein
MKPHITVYPILYQAMSDIDVAKMSLIPGDPMYAVLDKIKGHVTMSMGLDMSSVSAHNENVQELAAKNKEIAELKQLLEAKDDEHTATLKLLDDEKAWRQVWKKAAQQNLAKNKELSATAKEYIAKNKELVARVFKVDILTAELRDVVGNAIAEGEVQQQSLFAEYKHLAHAQVVYETKHVQSGKRWYFRSGSITQNALKQIVEQVDKINKQWDEKVKESLGGE